MIKITSVADKALRDIVCKVRSSFGVAALSDWAAYEISGPDAERFLQNRVSNDVKALQIGHGQLNASLDRQAKIEGVFSLHRLAEDTFWLIAPKTEAESAIRGIQKYHITEQFEVQPLTCAIWTIQGPQSVDKLSLLIEGATDAVSLPPFAHREACLLPLEVPESPATVRIVRRSLTGETGYLLLGEHQVLQSRLLALAEREQGVQITPEALDILRVEAGLPRFGTDYDTETLLPETGLEREAVSYSKGCYLGQETVARVKTYGMVQKALTGLLFEADAELPPGDSELFLDGKSVGVLKSGVFSPALNRPIAMAYLGKQERVPGKALKLEINGQSYPVTVQLLPFYESQDVQKSGHDLLQEGLKRFSEGFDEEAIRVLRLAIQQEPSLIEAYEALGVILARQERFHEAIELMEKVLLLDPDHVLAHTNLSVFYMKLGDKEKAEEEKAKATMAAFSRKARESGLFFDLEAEQRKKEQALQERLAMFQKALKFNPEDPLGNFGLGSVCLELKRYNEAIGPLEKVLKSQPRHTVAYLSLGKAYEGTGQIQEARDVYQKGIEVAAAKGDLMPLNEMRQRLERLTQ
jgi:folate-binding protein YgfZ